MPETKIGKKTLKDLQRSKYLDAIAGSAIVIHNRPEAHNQGTTTLIHKGEVHAIFSRKGGPGSHDVLAHSETTAFLIRMGFGEGFGDFHQNAALPEFIVAGLNLATVPKFIIDYKLSDSIQQTPENRLRMKDNSVNILYRQYSEFFESQGMSLEEFINRYDPNYNLHINQLRTVLDICFEIGDLMDQNSQTRAIINKWRAKYSSVKNWHVDHDKDRDRKLKYTTFVSSVRYSSHYKSENRVFQKIREKINEINEIGKSLPEYMIKGLEVPFPKS